jgi:hypothetical protein
MKRVFSLVMVLSFSVLLYSQQATGLEFQFRHKSKLKKINVGSFGFSGTLPSSYSLKTYTPYSKNQGNYGTCVSWSMSYSALTTQFAIKMKIKDRNLITSMAFCPYFTHNNSKEITDGCLTGNFFEDAGSELTDIGAKKFYLPMIGCATPNDDKMLIVARNYRVKDVGNIYNYEDDVSDDYESYMKLFMKKTPFKVEDIKHCLVNNKPAIFGIYLPPSFELANDTNFWEPTADEKKDPVAALLNVQGELHSLHAMTIVGYDDSKFGGAFEIQNSWGSVWGDNGFIWVKYEDLQKYVFQVLVIEMPAMVLKNTEGCITGDCNNGYGIYQHSNGEMYEGFFKNAKYNGNGIYYWADGSTYAGKWLDGTRNGEAVIYYSDGSSGAVAYEADKFQSGFQKYNYESGNSYTGDVKDGELNGYGIYTFATGDSYQGSFVKNSYNGLGKYRFANGSFYIGYFEDGKRNGKGLYVSNEGKMWGGKWSYDEFIPEKKHGFADGKVILSGDIQIGANKNYVDANCTTGDCLNGSGTRVYNGSTYVGQFRDGAENGFGKTTYQNGNVVETYYSDGTAVGVCKITYSDGTVLIGPLSNGNLNGYIVYFDEAGDASIGSYNNGSYEGKTFGNNKDFSSKKMNEPEKVEFKSIPITDMIK